jgi:DNA-binding CsgD family transcriptional regulator/PAS domain-containing protein
VEDAARALVRSSDLPLAVLELPSGKFLAVNPPLASALGSDGDALIGSSGLEQLHPGEWHAAQQCLRALADGSLTGYQAVRRQANSAHPDEEFSIWVSVADVGGTRVGLASLVPHGGPGRTPTPMPQLPGLGDLVLGTVDGSWRIDRISQDVAALLGVTPEECVGAPVLGAVHPSDVPAFLAAVDHARRGERAVRLTLRVSAKPQTWTEVAAVLATLSPGEPPPLAFVLIQGRASQDSPGYSRRETQLETHLLRIAQELRAAGLMPGVEQLPALAEAPKLGELTSRELAVLTRLLDGQRVPAIAAELFLSPSTVRNHLSSIYAKLGVRGQVDLIRLLRRPPVPSADA